MWCMNVVGTMTTAVSVLSWHVSFNRDSTVLKTVELNSKFWHLGRLKTIFLMLLPGNFFQFLSLDDIKEAKNIDLKEDEDDSKNEVG